MSKQPLTALEARALQDPDVRFGYDNYDVLRKLGEFVREMRMESALSQTALQGLSGIPQADISRLESGTMERGPTLLTLVRLAHAAGKQLVIGLKDVPETKEGTQGDAELTRLLSL
jgi:transcriptional regulator with XRE-family HTH domain